MPLAHWIESQVKTASVLQCLDYQPHEGRQGSLLLKSRLNKPHRPLVPVIVPVYQRAFATAHDLHSSYLLGVCHGHQVKQS